ncbi:MAG: nicotinate (nicotinamide) nucleotide adenylyltransferase [Treponema sp.]|nr:nicotinate (nicotinamide) nucleotide adenylyltransferase [Treponema sp.]
MRLAILGGSFNPVHLGHLFLAESALSAFNYDHVALIPAWRSPFKPDAEGMESGAKERLELVAASIAGDPRLIVDDCEIRREGISYTVDTLHDVVGRYCPEGKTGLIIGDDLAANFLRWHDSEAILDMADIIVARRDGSPADTFPFPCIRLDQATLPVSSAMLRRRIAAGKAWRYLMPEGARSIIEKRRLYGFSGPAGDARALTGSPAEIIRIEETVRQELPLDRFLHSRHTAVLAWDLCRRFGMDPAQGYLAGIIHDLGKGLPPGALLKLAKSDGKPVSRLEKKKPGLLHGRAAAVLLRERFGIHSDAIIEAVALHTSGGPDMGPLAKALYIADKIEVSRQKADPALRKLCRDSGDLDELFGAVLEQTVSWLRAKSYELSVDTYRLLEKMKRKPM